MTVLELLSGLWTKASGSVKRVVKRCECAGCELRRKVLGRRRDKGS